MPIVQDELWKHPGHPGMIVITANASIEQGRLVLNDEDGQEAVKRIPGIEHLCAEQVNTVAKDGLYGFIPVKPSRPTENKVGFGLLQTQRRWDEPVSLDLLQYSIARFQDFLSEQPLIQVRMKYPVDSESAAAYEQLAPLLSTLPANVTICSRRRLPLHPWMGINSTKELFLLVERWLLEGRFNTAVEFLMDNGYDHQAAVEQVMAVKRLRQESAAPDFHSAEQPWQQRSFV